MFNIRINFREHLVDPDISKSMNLQPRDSKHLLNNSALVISDTPVPPSLLPVPSLVANIISMYYILQKNFGMPSSDCFYFK